MEIKEQKCVKDKRFMRLADVQAGKSVVDLGGSLKGQSKQNLKRGTSLPSFIPPSLSELYVEGWWVGGGLAHYLHSRATWRRLKSACAGGSRSSRWFGRFKQTGRVF